MLCWLAVRSGGGRLLLRMDDIDGPRSRPEFARAIIRDLRWLGFDWDGPIYWQSGRTHLYAETLETLRERNLVYPCFCTRKELRGLASAPHMGEAAVYPGLCRDLAKEEREAKLAARLPFSLRIKTPDTSCVFNDLIQGARSFPNHGGDIAARRSDDVYSYQFATAVDDFLLDVNLIVRGRDLLSSAPPQLYLRGLLGAKTVKFAHVPSLLSPDGERLAKRHKASSVASMRERGVSPGKIIGEIAAMAGMNPEGADRTLRELIPRFSWDKIPREDLIWPDTL